MKREIIPLEAESIEAFAERHDLVMQIRQRHHEERANKWYARFKNSDIKEGCFLVGSYGDGLTIEHAIHEYARIISGCTIVVDAHKSNRREISVPQLS